MKLLMVEDNTSVSEMMGMFFKKENWDAHYAYDGNDAVTMFNEVMGHGYLGFELAWFGWYASCS